MPSGIRGLMRIIFLTTPAPSIPRASKSLPALPTLHLRAPSRCDIGGGVKAALRGLQYQAETATVEAREEGGFQERLKPIFQKENVTFLDEQETHRVKKSRTQSGRWGMETEHPSWRCSDLPRPTLSLVECRGMGGGWPSRSTAPSHKSCGHSLTLQRRVGLRPSP